MPIKWTDEAVAVAVRAAVAALGLKTMPTSGQFRSLRGGEALATQVSRRGGYDAWAARLGLPVSVSDTRTGWAWEEWFAGQARARGLFVVTRVSPRESFDLMINGYTVDVKAATGRWTNGAKQWVWKIARDRHASAFYALLAIGSAVPVVFIVPFDEVPLTTVTVRDAAGTKLGRYGKRREWLDRWDLLA